MKRVLALLLILVLAASAAPAVSAADEFGVGEVWIVDDLLTLEIVKVTEVEERNEYSDKDPEAVYIVDYVYKNLGYEDENWDGLYIGIDSQVVDAAGEMGYSYPGDYTYYPKETPVGAVCYAQCCIGVDNAGDFRLYVTEYDNDGNRHKATFNVEVDADPVEFAEIDREDKMEPYPGALWIGEAWVVDGQWSLTVTGITETEERNEFSDYDPAAVYIVDYSYTNLGYESDNWDGVYISLDGCVMDSVGFMGYSYPGDVTAYAKETPEGATCKAQACIGVWHPGDLQIIVTKYDGNEKRQSAAFYIELEPGAEKTSGTAGKDAPAGDDAEIRAEIRDFVDGYEAAFAEFTEFSKKMEEAEPVEMVDMLDEYMGIVEKVTGYIEQQKQIDPDELSDAEKAYFDEAMARINELMSEAGIG